MEKQGTFHKMDIPQDREIIHTDSLAFPWNEDKAGYFLVKVEGNEIQCGFLVNHKMVAEFRGENPYNIIKEIAKRYSLTPEHMGYISAELVRAKHCIETDKEFVQR